MHGGELEATLEDTAPANALSQAKNALELDTIPAIASLGQSCSISSALPSVIYLALKFKDDLQKAFSENAMAGGDNCARGLALGMLLGSAYGLSAIPSTWKDDLKVAAAKPFIQSITL